LRPEDGEPDDDQPAPITDSLEHNEEVEGIQEDATMAATPAEEGVEEEIEEEVEEEVEEDITHNESDEGKESPQDEHEEQVAELEEGSGHDTPANIEIVDPSAFATPRTASETPVDTPTADTSQPLSPASQSERKREGRFLRSDVFFSINENIGKRKATDGEESEAPVRKRAREESEPIDDESQGKFPGSGGTHL
jgi:hypothetical protein